MTGQEGFAGYAESGVRTAVQLVNELATERAFGRDVTDRDPFPSVRSIFAADPTWPSVRPRDLGRLTDLAGRLRSVIEGLADDDRDGPAAEINVLLAAHPAHPHLSKDDGRWRLHHHPAAAALIPMTTAITAEAIARVIAAGEAARLGICVAERCDRAFFDTSKNGSRRFCSTACQNRTKATTFRQRRLTDT